MVSYASWFRTKMRGRNVERISLEPGKIYAFAYEPSRQEKSMTDVDLAVIFIPLRMRSAGMRGLNMVAIQDRNFRLRVFERYLKSRTEGNQSDTAKVLYDLFRVVISDKRSGEANKMYRFRGIRGKVVELTEADLEELIKRVL